MDTNQIVARGKELLEARYGPRFAGLVLYGSEARHTSEPGSDIDLLVLLHPPLDWFAELRTIVDTLYPLQMETERHISAKPAAVDEFESGCLQLYRNAKREGSLV